MNLINILLIDDNEGDILLTQDAFEQNNLAHILNVVRDGKQAIEFLCRRGIYENESLPDLILLDINLPKKNGHEVLFFIKNTENLKHIPVIMLTTSSAPSDIQRAYKNHVNCYILKPVDIDQFQEIISQIELFWLTIVTFSNRIDDDFNY